MIVRAMTVYMYNTHKILKNNENTTITAFLSINNRIIFCTYSPIHTVYLCFLSQFLYPFHSLLVTLTRLDICLLSFTRARARSH